MKEIADTIVVFAKEQPQMLLDMAIAVLVCIALYQLIRVNVKIRKITQKVKQYMDAVMEEADFSSGAQDAASEDAASEDAAYGGIVELTAEEKRCLLEGTPKESGQKKHSKKDEAIFNEVLQEYLL